MAEWPELFSSSFFRRRRGLAIGTEPGFGDFTITTYQTSHNIGMPAPRVLVGWPLPLGFGLDGRLLLARRGRVCAKFIIA